MALTAANVIKQFIRKRSGSNVFNAVDGVNLSLESGTISVVTGPSGSGKSTLLNMMAGILAPTSGIIALNGTDLYSMDDRALSAFRNRHIGVIPQGQTAIYSLTVRDNVLLPWKLYGMNRKVLKKAETETSIGTSETALADPVEADVLKRADELLDRTGIRDLSNVMPQELSGGEMRRMAIIRAMILKPDVILADEPTADLDEENTKSVLSLMRYAAEEGSAVMIVTHDKDVFAWADRVYTLRAGKLEAASV